MSPVCLVLDSSSLAKRTLCKRLRTENYISVAELQNSVTDLPDRQSVRPQSPGAFGED